MKDRELLELAAKAGGIKLYVWGAAGEENYVDMSVQPHFQRWNPLTDDGDALRLAVKSGIRLEFADGWVIANAGSVCAPQFSERTGSDSNAATRRAIVRAAAEIGKGIAKTAPSFDLPEDNYYKTQAEAAEIGKVMK